MKKSSNLIALICGLSLIGSGQAQLSEIEKDQKVGFNGSFEISKNAKPVNWLLYTNKTTKSGDFDVELVSSEYVMGKQSLFFDVRECSNIGGRHSPGIAKEIKAQPGETYKISYWVKNTEADFIVKVSGVNAFKKDEGPINNINQTNSNWTKYEHIYTIANNMNRIRFEMNVMTPGKLWIDDVKIVKQP